MNCCVEMYIVLAQCVLKHIRKSAFKEIMRCGVSIMSHTATIEETGETIEYQGVKNSSDTAKYYPLGRDDLHGRRQIFTNEREITRGNVVEILNKALSVHQRNRNEEIYLEKYVRGIQPILDRQKKYNDYVNNKVVVNVANQIVAFKTAEFAGEPIQYVSRGSKKSVPKKIERLNSLMISEGKQTKDMKLAHDMFTVGVGYRLILNDKAIAVSKKDIEDESPFEIYVLDPRNTFVIRRNDVTKRVVAGVTFVFTDEAQQSVEFAVYTETTVFTITGTMFRAEKVKTVQVHNFGMIPIVEYPCNTLYMGAFEPVLPLLDAYNLTTSNRLDGIEQFIQAIMVFEGVDVTREQFLELKDLGAIKLPPAMDGRSSKVYYLNEQLDQGQTQTLVDDMYQTILQIVGMPSQGNANTSDSSNNGAMIIKNGWWNAEARALETEGAWKQSEIDMLKIVLKIAKDANVMDGLSILDVEPKFTRRSYEDLLTKTQSFSTLRSAGCTSLQAFKFSHLSQDPESDAIAFDEYQKERADSLDMQSGLSVGGTGGSGASVTSYDETGEEPETPEEDTEEGDNSEVGYATCPVCKRRFKRKSSRQVYDRIECRRIAQRSKRAGGIR